MPVLKLGVLNHLITKESQKISTQIRENTLRPGIPMEPRKIGTDLRRTQNSRTRSKPSTVPMATQEDLLQQYPFIRQFRLALPDFYCIAALDGGIAILTGSGGSRVSGKHLARAEGE